MSLTITPVPNISELHPAFDGEGLLVSGYAATFDLDKVNDKINPYALDATVARYMATNPVLMYAHKLGLPPVGRVIRAEIHRAKGLWIEAIMPRPRDGSFGAEVWEAVKNGVLRAMSVGGAFFRNSKGSHNEVHGMRLDEISICPIAVSGSAFATAVTPTHVKCLADGGYVPIEHYREYKAITDERDDLLWMAAQLQRKRDLEEIKVAVARARLGIRTR
ncbi:MAG: HK97 family phage prohead protease [Solirubrobacterales bacterium]